MNIPLYLGPEHACSYLPGRDARSVYIDPYLDMDATLYSALIEQGFRRSGMHVYRPHCKSCAACVPVRVPVKSFKMNRSQARILKKNADLKVTYVKPRFEEEHFQLFKRYMKNRHEDQNKPEFDPEQYSDFLIQGLDESFLVEFRLDEKLLAIAVIDFLDTAISAVYTFYDLEFQHRSLGVYAVLWQIQTAQAMGLDWVYLGFWVEDSQKMDYKKNYRPLEAFIDHRWRLFEKNEKIEA